ncbi:restriction endonuclease subunit S [Vibrio cyclitrophicus]|uniref:restriction endonuclease subunit S n=1 Tax=Vibrio cyclitrophicus TaxID=47951 RepID=UPI000C817EFE|nr:restriction endonuclease subunit S [Vibrio cyclitrophicus]PMF33596.1 hypothetical protein BCV15_08225 [Vibrio cyclitrophicus]
MTEQMNVPKLRFGEFEDDWKQFPLMSLLNKVIDYRGQSVPKAETGIPLITAKNVKKGYLDFTSAEYVDESQFESWATRGKPKGGDVLFTTEAPLGNVCFFPSDKTYAVGQRTVTLVGGNKLDNSFLLHLMLSPRTQQSIDAKSSGSTAKGIKSSELKKLPVTVSTALPEQQKIASFLSKVDEKIGLLSEKKDKLTEYKRGVMQQLFNGKWQEQNGQLTFTPPTLRFKADDGSEFPDWEEKRYSDLFTTFRSGQGITSSNIKELGEYPVYGGNGLRGYTNQYTHDGFYFLIGRQGALCGNINRVTGKNYISEHAIACKVDNDLGTEFYAQRLEQINLNRFSESSAQPGLSVNKLLRFKMLAPCESEQAKIASFLLRLDEKVSITNSELNKAKEWKRGLLQQMFV